MAKKSNTNAYHSAYMARRRAGMRDLATLPAVQNPARRDAATASFEEFCRTYFPEQFKLPWSAYHRSAAAKIERAVKGGGFFAFAMPRASGKTTICRWGVLWSVLCGHCDYVVLIGASEKAAVRQLKNIRTSLARNPLLYADFPEAAAPIRQIVENNILPTKHTFKGESTHIEWSKNRIILPWIPLNRRHNSGSRGALIDAYGITSEIRGLNHTKPDNTSVRPQLALVDDPQTRESAKSVSQSVLRLETLSGDIAYLSGPDAPIAVVCPCTVIYENDLADQILDRDKHPEWQGERTKMVESFPTNMAKWDEYAEVLRASYRDGGDRGAPNAFYDANREQMDAGAVVSWEHRFKKDELSAIQHAMNLRIRNEAAFFAECQNEPLVAQDDLELLSADAISRKVSGYECRKLPEDCAVVTAFTDVQKEHLFWMVCAWAPDFTGYVIDYGAWPDQRRHYFTRRDVRNTLSNNYSGDESGILYAALRDLESHIIGPYRTGDGRELRLSRWCIDGNWRSRTSAVVGFAKQSDNKNIITVTQGRGVRASENPFSQAQRAMKWKSTHGDWFWQDGPGPARWVTFDANSWKTRVHRALSLSQESRGSIQLFKASAQIHQMIGEHLRAEKPSRVVANGRTVYEWAEIPGRDNEGLDCLVGCGVAASIAGIKSDPERSMSPTKKLAMTLLEYRDLARGQKVS